MIADDALASQRQRIDAAIGRTPVVRLTRVASDAIGEVWVKLEGMNPGGSIKDRTALGMILDAEERGIIAPGATIVEPTSGNTGIGLAQVASAISASQADITHIDMGEDRAAETTELQLMITVRDRQHLADVLRTMRRCAPVLRVWRVKS